MACQRPRVPGRDEPSGIPRAHYVYGDRPSAHGCGSGSRRRVSDDGMLTPLPACLHRAVHTPQRRARPLSGVQGLGEAYSRGVRQGLAELAWAGDWATRHDIWIMDYGNKSTVGYTDLMLTTKFCFSIPGEPVQAVEVPGMGCSRRDGVGVG